MKGHALCIIRYKNCAGFRGKLLGELVVAGRNAILHVWEPDLHEQCKHLAQFPPHAIRFEYRPSVKWGDALTKIESTKTEYELQELARLADERRGGGVKANSFLGRQIAKGVQRQVDAEHVSINEVVERH